MAITTKKRIVLLDAHAIIHRAYHALPDFSTAKGEPTGGLYGVVAMLLKIASELKPDYIVACYDLPGPTFRHDAYKDYKAGRAEAEDALVAQIERSRDIFSVFGIPIYEHPGFEADDILGTIVEQTKKNKNLEIIIASGDMDTLQLVDGVRVQVYTLRKGLSDTILYDEQAVKSRFGFAPNLLADFKGLRGDPSDNIIGIAGIGEKTATQLIQLFGGIEDIYKKLKKNKKDFEKKGIKPRIINLLLEGEEEAEFSKTLATIRRDAPISFEVPKKEWKEGVDLTAVRELFSELEFRTLLARAESMFGESGAAEPPVDEESLVGEEDVDPVEVRKAGIGLWLLYSDITNPTLDDILNFAKTRSFAEAKKKIEKELERHNLTGVYEDIELPLIPIVDKAQKRGILIDVVYLKELSREYHKELTKIEKKIYKHAGREFNINSPKQLSEILFDEMGLSTKGLKKTAGGARSTRESEIAKLKDEHAIIAEILNYRELQKLLSTYIDTIPEMVDENNRLHTTLNQTGTTTGRFSSTNPNLQNIPVREGVGEAIRDAFVATPGHVLVACDYSQIEMRVLAALSGDKKMIRFFKEGSDVHAAVAAQVFGVPEDKVSKDQRRKAKVINFGIVYGMGVNALRENLGGTRAEAQQFYNDYFMQFPEIAAYFEKVKQEAHEKRYVETLFGRRRFFEGINSHIPYIRAAAERMAVNAPIQGTATADIIKIAMRKVDESLKTTRLIDQAHLLLQVHDELMYEVEEEVKEKAEKVIRETMEHAVEIAVPLVVDVSEGESWGTMKKI